MTWIKTYEAYVYEAEVAKEIADLEKVLSFPAKSGIFQSVSYDKPRYTLMIEQPTDISAMDAGAVVSKINQEKAAIKRQYPGIKFVKVDDLQITI